MKEKGILLPIFSLPSKYGKGDFGNEAYEFVDILNENGMTYWEVLPINACDGLPYSPQSYYALNQEYISLDKLAEIGLIDEEKLKCGKIIKKEELYKEAFKNFKKKNKKNYLLKKFNKLRFYDYEEFIKCKEIIEYAEFVSKDSKDDIEYNLFLQYILFKQWIGLKEYANSKGIQIIGDMPMYPAFDSAETKYHPNCFEMKNSKFTYEAGTPPDYFNENGQKWNSPVYNINNIKKDDYEYLIKRFKYYLKLFDKVRIDYFRGYDSFFKIPIGKSGKDGEYVDGVSYGFFDKLFEENPEIQSDSFIVEDLGDIRKETIELRKKYNFTRQNILQFSIDLYNIYDKDNFEENVLTFPANHDCHTIYGWYKVLSDDDKWRLKEFLRRNECYDINVNIGMMQYCKKCKAKIVIIMVQDILGLDDSARLNVPGTSSEKNWSWQLENFDEFKNCIKDF